MMLPIMQNLDQKHSNMHTSLHILQMQIHAVGCPSFSQLIESSHLLQFICLLQQRELCRGSCSLFFLVAHIPHSSFFLLFFHTYCDRCLLFLKLQSGFSLNQSAHHQFVIINTVHNVFFVINSGTFSFCLLPFFPWQCYRLFSGGDLSLQSASGAKFSLPVALKLQCAWFHFSSERLSCCSDNAGLFTSDWTN